MKVHYLGVDYETGEEFDSSWGRGESINFPLQRLIKGWQEGIPGMKVGGRRAIVLRDLYELTEKLVDRCRDVGNVAMHIVLKNS